MLYIRAFIAGMIVPSVLLCLAQFFLLILNSSNLIISPFVHMIPIIWGLWNVLYFAVFYKFLYRNQNVRLFITGFALGLIVAIISTWLRLPEGMGIFSEERWYLPLIIGPILYGFVWVLVIKPLNEVVGLSDSNWISFR